MKTLGDVKVGESSTIVKLHGEGALSLIHISEPTRP